MRKRPRERLVRPVKPVRPACLLLVEEERKVGYGLQTKKENEREREIEREKRNFLMNEHRN